METEEHVTSAYRWYLPLVHPCLVTRGLPQSKHTCKHGSIAKPGDYREICLNFTRKQTIWPATNEIRRKRCSLRLIGSKLFIQIFSLPQRGACLRASRQRVAHRRTSWRMRCRCKKLSWPWRRWSSVLPPCTSLAWWGSYPVLPSSRTPPAPIQQERRILESMHKTQSALITCFS